MRSRTTSTATTTVTALALLWFAAAMLVLLLSGCKAKRTLEEHRSDTLRTEIRSGVQQRDTLLTVPGSRVEASLPLPPPGADLPPTTARGDRAWSTVVIRAGTLTHSGGCDTVELRATLWDRWQRESSAHTVVQVRTETKEVPVTPKWAWWALGIATFLALWRLWPLLRLIKPF